MGVGGYRKTYWTAEEEEVLLAGIAKHGSGKWSTILGDPEFASQLVDRSNIDLKVFEISQKSSMEIDFETRDRNLGLQCWIFAQLQG